MKKRNLLLLLLFISLAFFDHAQNAYMTSALINSCNGTCSEGDNEILFGNTGNGTLLVNSTNLQLFYGSTSPASTSYTDALTTNPTTTSNLNAAAGCTLFLEAVGSTIPANASFVVVRNTICTSALNWTGLCGSAPIYIIYSTDASWSATGNFGNGTGVNRFFRSIITTSAGTSTINYTYNLPAIYSTDGAFANWTAAGGNAVLYGDNDCSITPTALSMTVEKFELSSDENHILWRVSDNLHIARFEIQHSQDGAHFETIASQSASEELDTASYSWKLPQDLLNHDGYFQLSITDKDGSVYRYPFIIRFQSKNSQTYWLNENILHNNGRYPLRIFSLTGSLLAVLESGEQVALPSSQLVLIQTETDMQRLFIP